MYRHLLLLHACHTNLLVHCNIFTHVYKKQTREADLLKTVAKDDVSKSTAVLTIFTVNLEAVFRLLTNRAVLLMVTFSTKLIRDIIISWHDMCFTCFCHEATILPVDTFWRCQIFPSGDRNV